jgi:DNA polymerase-3 subunit alpha
MSRADFVHLRVHTAYSLSEGALPVDELVKLCRAKEMPATAITDTNNLFGALEFSAAAAKAGVQPSAVTALATAAPTRAVSKAPTPTRWCCWYRTKPAIAIS